MLHLDPDAFEHGIFRLCRDGEPLIDLDPMAVEIPDGLSTEEAEQATLIVSTLNEGDGAQRAPRDDELTPWLGEKIDDWVWLTLHAHFMAEGCNAPISDFMASLLYTKRFPFRPYVQFSEFTRLLSEGDNELTAIYIQGILGELELTRGDTDASVLLDCLEDIRPELVDNDNVDAGFKELPTKEAAIIRERLLKAGCIPFRETH